METDGGGQDGGCWGTQQGPESGHQPQPLSRSPADFAPGGGDQKRKHLGHKDELGPGPRWALGESRAPHPPGLMVGWGHGHVHPKPPTMQQDAEMCCSLQELQGDLTPASALIHTHVPTQAHSNRKQESSFPSHR